VRIGSDEAWDFVETALENAIRKVGRPYVIDPGEGAFYGPKLDFKLTDAIGREWQCGTFQVDPNLPARLGAEYVGEDGAKHRPFMLHRAILGSFERFLGVLIEHYAGKLPLWLAPRQIVVAPIVSDANGYAEEVVAALTAAGLRAEAELRNETSISKVREHSLAKVPVILAVGQREVADRTVSVRRLGEQASTVLPVGEVVRGLAAEATPPELREHRAGRFCGQRIAALRSEACPRTVGMPILHCINPVTRDRERMSNALPADSTFET
jgi:threonyl-tRNA synthetase